MQDDNSMKHLSRRMAAILASCILLMLLSACFPAASADAAALDDGSPWIDSELKANIPETCDVTLTDDFHLAVNYDWLRDTDIPDGHGVVSPFQEVQASPGRKLSHFLRMTVFRGMTRSSSARITGRTLTGTPATPWGWNLLCRRLRPSPP